MSGTGKGQKEEGERKSGECRKGNISEGSFLSWAFDANKGRQDEEERTARVRVREGCWMKKGVWARLVRVARWWSGVVG